MNGPGRPFMAAKHSAVSSVMTGPPICTNGVVFRRISVQLKWKRKERGDDDQFCCAPAFFNGYLLRGTLDFWH